MKKVRAGTNLQLGKSNVSLLRVDGSWIMCLL